MGAADGRGLSPLEASAGSWECSRLSCLHLSYNQHPYHIAGYGGALAGIVIGICICIGIGIVTALFISRIQSTSLPHYWLRWPSFRYWYCCWYWYWYWYCLVYISHTINILTTLLATVALLQVHICFKNTWVFTAQKIYNILGSEALCEDIYRLWCCSRRSCLHPRNQSYEWPLEMFWWYSLV